MLFSGKNCTKVALYLRLSREDGDKAESESISNQRELLADYLKEHPTLTAVEEYADDGYSGTSFERPAFKRMMEDAKRKKINCILVKDLSRLGRNYIEVGRYLEKIFPLMGIRFIAIIDHYDSADQDSSAGEILVPFKNLINDSYCRDISKNIRTQLDIKRKQGDFIGSFAAYGYQKSSENKNRLVIDENAAKVVRLIFEMKIRGASAQYIGQHLNEMGVLTPMEYKRSCGFNFNSGFRARTTSKWDAKSVLRVLTNESYTGVMVQGKNRKINYKVKKSVPIQPEKWIRIEDTHEAIIPKDVFDEVQDLLKKDTRAAPNQAEVYLLSGFVRCADCGQSMVRRTVTKNGARYIYYVCSTNKAGNGCSSHSIREDLLTDAILTAIQNQIMALVDAGQVMREMEMLPQEHMGLKTLHTQIEALQAEVERYQELKVQLYRDRQLEVVTTEEYSEISARFSERIAAAKESMAKLEMRCNEIAQQKTGLWPWMDSFCKYHNVEQLDRRVLSALVDHVTVYRKNKIEVVFRFQDEIEQMLGYVADLTDGETGGKENVAI